MDFLFSIDEAMMFPALEKRKKIPSLFFCVEIKHYINEISAEWWIKKGIAVVIPNFNYNNELVDFYSFNNPSEWSNFQSIYPYLNYSCINQSLFNIFESIVRKSNPFIGIFPLGNAY